MYKPIFITVHGFRTKMAFTINVNAIERLAEKKRDNIPYTAIYMIGSYEKQDNERVSNYNVSETIADIDKLVTQAAVQKP